MKILCHAFFCPVAKPQLFIDGLAGAEKVQQHRIEQMRLLEVHRV